MNACGFTGVEAGLDEVLREGIAPEELPTLYPLLRGRGLLRGFSALFHGSENQVLLRLLVLRSLGSRSEAPEWTTQEIREHLAFAAPVKLETVVQRLKDHDLLHWNGETQRYRVGPLGRKALAALTTLLEFEADEQDPDGLGYITAQLAAGQALGKVSADELGHLLARLSELKDDFDRAVLSGSEHRIRAAAGTLEAVWVWVEKGTQVIRAITELEELSTTAHRLAQAVGRAQSAMLRQAGVFQRELNKIDQHRIHLGRSGLSSSDLIDWLRRKDAALLAGYADDQVLLPLLPPLLQDQIALDVAEYELLERERVAAAEAALPASETIADETELAGDAEDLGPLLAWREELNQLNEPLELSATIRGADYALSAYRLSLLGLIGDPESTALAGETAELARLPLQLEVEPRLLRLDAPAISEISAGRLQPHAAPPAAKPKARPGRRPKSTGTPEHV